MIDLTHECVMGIDPGLKNTGFVICEIKSKRIIEYGILNTYSQGTRVEDMFRVIREWIDKVLARVDLKEVIIERQPPRVQNRVQACSYGLLMGFMSRGVDAYMKAAKKYDTKRYRDRKLASIQEFTKCCPDMNIDSKFISHIADAYNLIK